MVLLNLLRSTSKSSLNPLHSGRPVYLAITSLTKRSHPSALCGHPRARTTFLPPFFLPGSPPIKVTSSEFFLGRRGQGWSGGGPIDSTCPHPRQVKHSFTAISFSYSPTIRLLFLLFHLLEESPIVSWLNFSAIYPLLPLSFFSLFLANLMLSGLPSLDDTVIGH